MKLYKKIDNPQEGEMVQYLGMYALRWTNYMGSPSVGFIEVEAPELTFGGYILAMNDLVLTDEKDTSEELETISIGMTLIYECYQAGEDPVKAIATVRERFPEYFDRR